LGRGFEPRPPYKGGLTSANSQAKEMPATIWYDTMVEGARLIARRWRDQSGSRTLRSSGATAGGRVRVCFMGRVALGKAVCLASERFGIPLCSSGVQDQLSCSVRCRASAAAVPVVYLAPIGQRVQTGRSAGGRPARPAAIARRTDSWTISQRLGIIGAHGGTSPTRPSPDPAARSETPTWRTTNHPQAPVAPSNS
jgi:hypothetical protein